MKDKDGALSQPHAHLEPIILWLGKTITTNEFVSLQLCSPAPSRRSPTKVKPVAMVRPRLLIVRPAQRHRVLRAQVNRKAAARRGGDVGFCGPNTRLVIGERKEVTYVLGYSPRQVRLAGNKCPLADTRVWAAES